MAAPTKAQLATARDFLARAGRRIDGAAKAATRPGADPGEFDNNFDGVVSAIFHVVDAYELATTGIKRKAGEAEQATRIESVLAATNKCPPRHMHTRAGGCIDRRHRVGITDRRSGSTWIARPMPDNRPL